MEKPHGSGKTVNVKEGGEAVEVLGVRLRALASRGGRLRIHVEPAVKPDRSPVDGSGLKADNDR
jgi:hypothetical protein